MNIPHLIEKWIVLFCKNGVPLMQMFLTCKNDKLFSFFHVNDSDDPIEQDHAKNLSVMSSLLGEKKFTL